MEFSKLLLFCVFVRYCNSANVREINASAYFSMPDIVKLDYFKKCKYQKETHQYCFFEIFLNPIENQSSNAWHVIQEVNKNPTNFRHDFAFRSHCLEKTNLTEEEELKRFYNVLNDEYSEYKLQTKIGRFYCNKFDQKLDLYAIIAIVIIGLVIVFNLTCTLIDIYIINDQPKNNLKIGIKLLQCYSLKRNFQRLCSINDVSESEHFKYVQGIRFLTISFFLFGHTISLLWQSAGINVSDFEERYDEFQNSLVMGGPIFVQTFFVLSAFMLAIPCFKIIYESKFQLRHIFWGIYGRYIRLTPSFAIVTLFITTILFYMGDGALWSPIIGIDSINCQKNWWANLLYISNEIKPNEMCLLPGWYLSADFQLYTFSLFLLGLIALMKNRAKMILGTGLVISIIIPGALTYIYKLDPLVLFYPIHQYQLYANNKTFQITYMKSYCNASSYMIGLFMGYLYYKRTLHNIKIKSKLVLLLIHTLIFALVFGILFSSYYFYLPTYKYNRIVATIYVATYKLFLAISISLLILVLTNKQGSKVYEMILEWKPFVILGRLSFSVYLVHWPLIRAMNGLADSTTHYGYFRAIGEFYVSVLVIAHLLGLLLALLVEFPMSGITKVLMERYQDEIEHDSGKTTQVKGDGDMELSYNNEKQLKRVFQIEKFVSNNNNESFKANQYA